MELPFVLRCVYTQNNLSRKYTKCMENTFMRDRCIGNRIVFYVDFKHSPTLCYSHIAAWGLGPELYTQKHLYLSCSTQTDQKLVYMI